MSGVKIDHSLRLTLWSPMVITCGSSEGLMVQEGTEKFGEEAIAGAVKGRI